MSTISTKPTIEWDDSSNMLTNKLRKTAKTEFFSFLILATTEMDKAWLHIDTHRVIYHASYAPWKFELPFTGPNAMEMAIKFAESLAQLEGLVFDYIRMTQQDIDYWVHNQEAAHSEDNQPGDSVGESGSGSGATLSH